MSINEQPIKQVNKVKYLGVTVDENLTRNEHNKKLKYKIKATLSSLQKLKNIIKGGARKNSWGCQVSSCRVKSVNSKFINQSCF